jgi:hypothetical protein
MKIFGVLLLMLNLALGVWMHFFEVKVVAGSSSVSSLSAFAQSDARLVLLQEDLTVLRFRSKEVLAKEPVLPTRGSVVENAKASVVQFAPSPQVKESVPVVAWCGASDGVLVPESAEAFLAVVKKLGGQGRADVEEVPVAYTWWVHLPPFPTEAAAKVVLDELQGKKIDSFYMRAGELMGGISLGVFSREESADVARQDLQKKGYKPEIRRVARMEKQSKVSVTFVGDIQSNDKNRRELLVAFPAIKLKENACK